MKNLEIGDKIRYKNTFNNFIVTITRVTKTKAVGVWGENGEHKIEFKREYNSQPRRFKPIRWDTTDLKLIE